VVLRLEDGARLVVNLGMTGRLVLSDAPRAAELTHVAVAFRLDDGRSLFYDDVRRFGLLQLFEPGAWHMRDAELGLEPLADELTAEALWTMTRRTRVPIRNFLLDQYRVAGVGNIYALEACYRAGIRPTRRAHRLSRAEAARLRDELRNVLRQAIRHRGTTFSDYRDASGEAGDFGPLLRIYGREGEPCPTCGAPIKRKVLTNRSAFYCPACQR
jgi:formamidopyrimidine-DNA glycosylase